MRKTINIIFAIVVFLTFNVGYIGFIADSGDDVLHNFMDEFIFAILMIPTLILEFEIYRLCIYGFFKEKSKKETIFRILSLAMAIIIICLLLLMLFFVTTNKIEIWVLLAFLLYLLLKIIGFIIFNK